LIILHFQASSLSQNFKAKHAHAKVSLLEDSPVVDVDVDVVDLRAQADASMPAFNNNVNYTIYSSF